MPLPELEPLDRECAVFTAYLLGCTPSDYVLAKYRDAHQKVQGLRAAGPFDRLMLDVARARPWLTRSADAYARVMAPRSALRKKLIVLLAILESCSPSFRRLESVETHSRLLLLAKAIRETFLFLLSFLLGAVVLLPSQIALGLDPRTLIGSR